MAFFTDMAEKNNAAIKELRVVTDNLFEHLEEVSEKVDTLERNLTTRIDSLTKNQENMTRKMDLFEKNQETMMNNIDFIVGEMQRKREEEAAGTHLLKEHGQRIVDHETRIGKLEGAVT